MSDREHAMASDGVGTLRVSVVGTGYVGLVTGACLAEKGHHVVCVDIDEARIEKIRKAVPPIRERGLHELLERNVGVRLEATTDLRRAVLSTDVTLITVGTPFGLGQIDLRFVREAAEQIGHALKAKGDFHVVVVKSTVVPGTTDEVVVPILETASGRRAGVDLGVGVNPEFLTEGQAITDFMHPDRIVIGGADDRTLDVLARLYRTFEGVTCVRTNNRTAEMIKYASNALLATAISFANEIGNLCGAIGGVDVADVMHAVHLSEYLSPHVNGGGRVKAPITSFLWAGCGFGGSCLPKDVKALVAHGARLGTPMSLLQAVVRVNERQYEQVLSRVRKHFPSLRGVRVVVLGLAFRPDTDDMRESPAIPIVKALLAEGADVRGYDPAVRREAAAALGVEIPLYDGIEPAVREAQAVVLVTRWEEFRRVPELLRRVVPPPVVVDGRRMLDPRGIARYEGIGL